jgi:uncharacterized membrane protein YhaH (DUF805 family)
MMHYYFRALKKYADFKGRARRKEFWFFMLWSTIIYFVLGIIDAIGGFQVVLYTFPAPTINTETGTETTQLPPFQLGILWMLYCIAIIIPTIAISVRRLHDINRTGWLYLLILVCFLGSLALIVLYIIPGTKGENKYGPDPIQE